MGDGTCTEEQRRAKICFVKFLLNPFLFARPEINFKPLCQQRERVEPGYLIT